MNLPVGELLYSLTRNIRPKVVVEIGAFIGYSTICFAQAMEDNQQNEGIVYSIDVFLPFISNPNLTRDISDPYSIAVNNVKKAHLEHRVKFLKGKSSEIAPKLLKQINNIKYFIHKWQLFL